MRIGIDIRSLQTKSMMRGVGVYTSNLVQTLIRIDSRNEYFLFASSRQSIWHLSDDLRRRIIPLKRPARGIILWDQIFWYPLLKKCRIDIFHSPVYASPIIVPKNVAVVQTVHDLIPMIFKKSTTPQQRFIFRMNFYLLKYTDALIAVSQNTKKDITRYLKIPEEKIIVIYNGIDHLSQQSLNEKRSPVKGIAKDRPFLLYVGGTDPLKNIPILIQAFDKIWQKNKNLKLIMIGADVPSLSHLKLRGMEGKIQGRCLSTLMRKLLQSGKIVLKGYLEREDLISYYRMAELFIFPSLYEGFGFPPLEAMSQGLPVVASNRGSLPEILGNAAIYVNPEDPAEVARKVDQILHDEGLKVKMRENSLQRSSQFLWEDSARKILDLYHLLARSKKKTFSS